ncbi:MAG: hydantoinase/oxoprolinase family protein [Promethearchaeota archaeon]
MDIGGANTKVALVQTKKEKIVESYSYIEYFPFWENAISKITDMLNRIIKNIVDKNNFDLDKVNYVAIAITAELSDAFQTKREGILVILDALEQVFDISKMRFITTQNKFIDYESSKLNYSLISAANWVSTALFLGEFINQCILIDAGSTTIDLIPIIDSVPVSKGKDDISRLINHELIYTGGLRATIPSITHYVPYKNQNVRISFEKFALVSDVHRILKNITSEEYLNDTADNRSKSLEDCYARLSRIICMDLEMISKNELDLIAKYIYQKQLMIITKEIRVFMDNLILRFPEFRKNPTFIITGLSAEFLIKKPLKDLGYTNILRLEEITKISDNITSSAFAVAGALFNQLLNM